MSKTPILIIKYTDRESAFMYDDIMPIFKDGLKAYKYMNRLTEIYKDKYQVIVLPIDIDSFVKSIKGIVNKLIVDPPPIPISLSDVGMPGTVIDINGVNNETEDPIHL